MPSPSALPRWSRELGGVVLLGAVVVVAAEFAHLFRETILATVELISGSRDATVGAARLRRPMTALVVGVGVTAAVLICNSARRRANGRLGLTAIHQATTGAGPGPALPPTAGAASGTWVASAAMTSIGRETAILDVGGAVGAAVGRRWFGFGPALAAAGVAAGFASAYHAPIAAAIYVEGHIGVRQDRRTLLYVIVAAGAGHLLTVKLLHGHAIFPGRQGSWPGMVVLAAIGVVPAVVGSRLFRELRNRLPVPNAGRRRSVATGALVVVAAALVACFPLSAGNGMEALRNTSMAATASAAFTLGVVKLVATTAALRAGVHGGVFSPSLAVAGGWALLTFSALAGLGITLPGNRWDGMLALLAVGVAVSLDAPALGAVVVAEMAGELSLIPLCAAVALIARFLDRQLTVTGIWSAGALSRRLRNEDG